MPHESATEAEARAVYIGLAVRPRSVRAVREALLAQGKPSLSIRAMEDWCAKNEWVRLAAEHDEKVATQATERIAEAATQAAVTLAKQYQDIGTEAAKQALAGLKKIEPDKLTAQGIKALIEASTLAVKTGELLEGRPTDRTEHLTKQKIDDQLAEMQREIADKLRHVEQPKAVH